MSKPLLICWCALLLGIATTIHAQDIPARPTPPRLVNDLANLFDADQQVNLEKTLDDYNDSTSTQIVVLTIPSLGNWDIEEFAHTVGDKWAVGQKGKDNGVVMVIAPNDRKVFISTGRGSEGSLTDVTAKHIVDNEMTPRFKQNDYYGGALAGVQAIMQAMRGEYQGNPQARQVPHRNNALIIIAVIVLLYFIFRNRGGGNRGVIGRRGFSPWAPIFWGSMLGGGGGGFGGGSGRSGGGGGFGGFGGGSFGGGGAGGSW